MPKRCSVHDCQRKDIQADHIIPLAGDGLDCKDNLQPLCAHHNTSKSDGDPRLFAYQNGMSYPPLGIAAPTQFDDGVRRLF